MNEEIFAAWVWCNETMPTGTTKHFDQSCLYRIVHCSGWSGIFKRWLIDKEQNIWTQNTYVEAVLVRFVIIGLGNWRFEGIGLGGGRLSGVISLDIVNSLWIDLLFTQIWIPVCRIRSLLLLVEEKVCFSKRKNRGARIWINFVFVVLLYGMFVTIQLLFIYKHLIQTNVIIKLNISYFCLQKFRRSSCSYYKRSTQSTKNYVSQNLTRNYKNWWSWKG